MRTMDTGRDNNINFGTGTNWFGGDAPGLPEKSEASRSGSTAQPAIWPAH